MKNKLKYLFVTALLIALTVCFTVSASAADMQTDELTETEDAENSNMFSKAYAEITAYAGEILCAMTFVGSLVLAVAYKKGLLPLLKGSLISIGNAVSKIKEDTSESIEKHSQLTDGLEGAKNMLEGLTEKVDTLDLMLKERLEDESRAEKEKAAFKLIISSQIDMLYDIFMASALPQYQKDAVGERIAAMKGELLQNDPGD